MARRLRPPSEPPRPLNGHSPLPPEPAPWAAAPDAHAEVPWDRPAAEPWPPTTDEATADLWEAAPATHSWPPAPATTEKTPEVAHVTAVADVTEAADATEVPEPTGAASEGPVQPQPAPWDTETAPIWGGPAPWDPQPMPAQTDAVAEAEPASVPEAAAPEPEAAAPAPEAEVAATDMSVPGRPAWDVPAFAEWDEADAVDDRPSDMLHAYDEMVPVVTQRVAEAQAAAAEPTTPVEPEPEPVAEAVAAVAPEPEPVAEAVAAVAPEPEPVAEAVAVVEPEPPTVAPEAQSPFAWPSLLDESSMPVVPSPKESAPWAVELEPVAAESEPVAAESEPVAEASTTAETEAAPWSDFVEGPREFEAAPTWLTQYSPTPDEPVATSMSADPYDAEAPVLDEVQQSAAPVWLDWSPASDVNPVAPSAVGGRILGPTPPDDLFAQPSALVQAWLEPEPADEPAAPETPVESEAVSDAEPAAEVTYHDPEPEPDLEPASEPEPEPEQEPAPAATHIAATTTQSLVFSTGPGQQPLVLRIELAIVDNSIQLRPADMARRVGPWSDEEPVTPRHPEFEPRTHAPTVPAADNEPAADAAAPWAAPADAHRSEVIDLPWDLPALAESNPTDAWTLDSAPADPLASLPAATFAPPAPATRPVDPPHVDPPAQAAPAAQATAVDVSNSALQSVAVAPVAPAPAARAQTNPDQSDLWFLASEATTEGADAANAAQIAPASSAWTTVLTVGMAVVVIFLVLAFIYLMTGLLR